MPPNGSKRGSGEALRREPYVGSGDIDRAEVARRAGTTGGESFFAFRCATCGRVYLGEANAGGDLRAYPNPADMTESRAVVDDWLVCVGCSAYIEAAALDAARRADPAAEAWRVLRDEMTTSRWTWVLRRG